MAHSQAKIQAFFREFPFLLRYIQKGVHEVRVSRIHSEFLSRTRQPLEYRFGFITLKCQEKILLLSEEGEELCRVGYRLWHRNPNYRWWKIWEPRWLEPGSPVRPPDARRKIVKANREETIGDAVNQLPNPANVYYAISIRPVLFGERVCWDVTVFKPPKGFSLLAWVIEQQHKEEREIKTEIETIDAEGSR